MNTPPLQTGAPRLRRERPRRAALHTLLFVAATLAGAGVTGCEHTGLMKTPNLYIETGRDPFADLPPEKKSIEVDLIYATDRAPVPVSTARGGTGIHYGHARSASLGFGRATVALGTHVTWDDLHEASLTRSRDRRLVPYLAHTEELGRFPASLGTWTRDDGELVRTPEIARQIEATGAILNETVARALVNADEREAFIFIHGFNNQFRHAALTMAQLWHFMGRPGVPVIYSWPAGRGGLRGYTSDSESARFTIFHLKQFLRTLAETPGLEQIHILAHSRGTDVATSALKELMLEYRDTGKDARTELKLGNLVLAAPDLDLNVVNQSLVADGMIFVPEQFTIYLSTGDRALQLSSWFADSVRRLGRIIFSELSPEERDAISKLANVTFIDADVESDITGHAYFWTNPAASSDLILLLRDELAPGAEYGRPLLPVSENFWRLRDAYPKLDEAP